MPDLAAIAARLLFFYFALSPAAGAQKSEDKGRHDFEKLVKAEPVITHWEDISVVRADNQLFLQDSSGIRKHLYTDKNPHCSVDASFLSKTRVYLQTCSHGAFVADLGGTAVYTMPNFRYCDVVADKSGTRFAVFERGRSAWHEFGQDSYDKLRVLVYSTADGKKLLQHKWK